MQGAVVFYSFSGNTKRACLFLKDKVVLAGGSLDLIDLRLEKEITSFFGQCLEAALKKKPVLLKTDYDLKKYDFLIFASPVWAFTYAPALRSYLDKIKGLENKITACFLTFGSGAGKNKALKELENILKSKKARMLFSKNLSGAKTGDSVYLESCFKTLQESVLK